MLTITRKPTPEENKLLTVHDPITSPNAAMCWLYYDVNWTAV